MTRKQIIAMGLSMFLLAGGVAAYFNVGTEVSPDATVEVRIRGLVNDRMALKNLSEHIMGPIRKVTAADTLISLAPNFHETVQLIPDSNNVSIALALLPQIDQRVLVNLVAQDSAFIYKGAPGGQGTTIDTILVDTTLLYYFLGVDSTWNTFPFN